MLTSCAVAPAEETLLEPAAKLAQHLELPIVDPEMNDTDYLLLLTSERLELHKSGEQSTPLFVDFSRFVFRQGKEPIAKAVGLKGKYKPHVLDCTAGLGQDAFVLASQGCRVTMLERSKLIHALLADGLQRAKKDKRLAEVTGRLELIQANAADYLDTLTRVPDVIYLDPMYPETGKSAAKRKSMRFFRDLVGDDLDAETLLTKALALKVKRVVVKRPVKAPPLGGQKAQGSLLGKTTRFDIYA